MAEEKQEEQKPPDLVIQIRLTQEGFAVTGEVIKNEPIALFMLGKAIDTVKAFHVKQNTPVIQKGGMVNFARRLFK